MSELLTQFWQGLGPIQGNVVAAFVTVIVFFLGYFLQPSVRLRWGKANASVHKLFAEERPIHVAVEKHYLQNNGRKPASNVEFVFSSKPSEISIWEPRKYDCELNREGHYVVQIPNIAPKEVLIIDSIYVDIPIARILSVKCADCQGKEVVFEVNRDFGTWFEVAAGVLLFAGAVYILSFVFNFIF